MKNEYEKHEDPKDIEAILKSELIREAQEILAEIEADESLQGLTMPDEAEEVLMQRIQKLEEEKAAHEMLSEKDKEALRLGREIQIQKENKIEDDNESKTLEDRNEKVITFKKKKRRTCLLIALVAVLVMMVGMTAVGEVPLVTEFTKVLFGEAEMVKVNSEREDANKFEKGREVEVDVYTEIKDTFNVDIIELNYLPSKTEIIDYEIDKVLNRATIIYQCEETIMEYQMIFNYRNQVSGYMVEDKLINEEVFTIDNIVIQLQEYQIENGNEKMYVAQYVYEDVHYTFNAITILSKEEIEEILKNIKIF